MTERSNAEVDWSLGTWKGSRRRQHQEYRALPFSRKLELIEEMNKAAHSVIASRKQRGLPYIDPYTGERVPGGARVREDPPALPPNPENS